MRRSDRETLDFFLGDQPSRGRADDGSGLGRRRSWSGPRSGALVRRILWSLIPLVSLGIFAWIPFARRAHLVRSRSAAWVLVSYLALAVLAVVLAEVGGRSNPDSLDDKLSLAAGFIELTLMFVGAVHTWITFRPGAVPPRPRAVGTFGGPAAFRAGLRAPGDGIVRDQRGARRVAELRALLADDPAAAAGLGVLPGDAPRRGGAGLTVDVNRAPAEVMCAVLGWPAAAAASVVSARVSGGPFGSRADLAQRTLLDSYQLGPAVLRLISFESAGGGA